MLTAEALNEVVIELATRPGHEKVRALLYRLLVEGLGTASREIDFEKPAPEVNGRIDALLGRTVFELKSDLRRERRDAERGLARYLAERQESTGERYVGLATDGAEFFACFLRNGDLETVACYRTDQESPVRSWLGFKARLRSATIYLQIQKRSHANSAAKASGRNVRWTISPSCGQPPPALRPRN